ncbi:ABC transporter substrate-binding protein [Methyloversatilis sp.]|uniref:ABC transporter substrate-binding protein n=1 Tax=Methyloversatilis sp. TaxID=2569862 RepID=UPI0027365ADD|nr:ABC transporter substrate-binding protein [Methyloversatilis sp.]MDP2870906.1 ABC transporter substrate-binding protein [Methyloversatilis sp.]MDP3454130.1 ABC transporter substrate-binding protein [Methyloversatilis sp.]MDP3578296.1 ABC transporter substrate-binding protein [Methyloversatilis sp.]
MIRLRPLHRSLCRLLAASFASVLLSGCGEVWNNPYPAAESGRNVLYTAFTDRPKHLDPVQSYSENEITFTAQIYEAPLQYHYLKRPFELTTATAEAMPQPRFYDRGGRELPADAPATDIAESVYDIRIKPGIRYQPHPALAHDEAGNHLYHSGGPGARLTLYDFEQTGSRELEAADYAYQIKRLAHPGLHSPIFGLMSDYIVGLKEFGDTLKDAAKTLPPGAWLDLRQHALPGVEVIDRHTYRIRLKGKYPQFLYWLAMPFFAPVPWEADLFHAQPGMAERNLTLDWYPIGTGPYMLSENNPNARMVLTRNPNFRVESYPCEGEEGDRAAGLLADCGKRLPLVEQIVFTREKEQIPYWNKFLQGYYDASGISSDSFDQAVQFGQTGEVSLSDGMQAQGIRLQTSVSTSTMYMGFNMLDPVVGGMEERGRKLRQAIGIALDQEEFISIFQNGRGLPAQSPLPPGIFGYRDGREGMNPQMYAWVGNEARRKPIDDAKRLLAEAGWPNGRDAKTGEALVVNLDTTGTGLGSKARIDWLTKQFDQLGVQLVVRSTDYNRFQEKVRKGAAQLFFWGWNADYPDPENFLFLLYGPQSKVKVQGENAANYENAEFDYLFEKMKAMDNSPERQAILDRMLAILQHDAPWVWGFHPKSYGLEHSWVFNRKPSTVANNTMKYTRIDPALREAKRAEWNRPVRWPLFAGALLLLALVWPAWRHWKRSEQARAVGAAA